MRRLAMVLILAVAIGGLVAWRLDAFGSRRDAGKSWSGYIEAEYVLVTSALGGTLVELPVARGEQVAPGALLFRLDDAAERGARDEADAKLRQAEAANADLLTGKRPAEIDAIQAQRSQAAAILQQAEEEYQRQQRLRATGASSTKQADDARALRDQNRARLEELDAQLRVARLPGREDQIRAAEAAVAAARGALVQAEWRLAQKSGVAPAAGLVSDTLFRPGEMVGPGQPVVRLLPPENLKIRFYVPETEVARLAVGDAVTVRCDGCGAPIRAAIRFIAPQAEYTPPVIYSREQRARLVFLVEARPSERLGDLRVGQPVDVAVSAP